MHRNTWKTHERKVARFFGAERNPLSGGNSKHTRSDTLHKDLYAELKSGEQVVNLTWRAAEKLFIDTEEKAILENKIPLVVIKPAHTSSKIGDWTGYIRIRDGTFNGAIVALPLRVVKTLLEEGVLVAPDRMTPYTPSELVVT